MTSSGEGTIRKQLRVGGVEGGGTREGRELDDPHLCWRIDRAQVYKDESPNKKDM